MVSYLRGLLVSVGPRPSTVTVERAMRAVAAETAAYQEQLERHRALTADHSDDAWVEAEQDLLKARAAVEAAWLESTPVQSSYGLGTVVSLCVLAAGQSFRAFVIRRGWHMRRP